MEPKHSEEMSLLLSTYMDRFVMGTREQLNMKIRSQVLGEQLENSDTDLHNAIILCGSKGEGMALPCSDGDYMIINRTVKVMYPDERIPPNMAHKTILFMREADCNPGYVNLELGKAGQSQEEERLYNSLVRKDSLIFVSSDIYREQQMDLLRTNLGVNFEITGPSVASTEGDSVFGFECKSWPKEDREWVTRSRLYGWPRQTLINKIVQSGCHLVPVGDKCSDDTSLQWRISFVTAEKSLVYSFSHVQHKVYVLLKYFLRQIKDALKENIGDDDILCSYFMKTILFHAIENSSNMFWQDKNLFCCFWFCFNILITWVKAGFCPNYFIPTNNLFKRKVHGQHQQILLNILKHLSQMKWMCLSVGDYYEPIWKSLSDPSVQTDLQCTIPPWKIVLEEDLQITDGLMKNLLTERVTFKTITAAMHLLSTSQTNFDDIYTYHYAMKCLQILATEQVFPDNMAAINNKKRYFRLKKGELWMIPTAVFGTELLHLATFHFLTGALRKSLKMSKQVVALCKTDHSDRYLREVHRHKCLRIAQRFERLQKIFTQSLIFHHERMHLPHFSQELCRKYRQLVIPPLPYALFLTFLCCHGIGDTEGSAKALQNLKDIQYDDVNGGQKQWIVHTLLGICFQTIGDYHRAVQAYWESARSKTLQYEWNPAIERIAVVYLCMYASQRSNKV
ncbi:uncharacterized protein LOC132548316 [Ylistrum balloti]|uniref:uncharacterized protein LOC132548316 n=1 Tax=Ylistrum balloti TaxID=509963 RepID=UPI002905815E|nr:uncharacterized protein LOC132548316 [Ylistrum balloti]